MADRFPLIVDSSGTNAIKEIVSGDVLDLTGVTVKALAVDGNATVGGTLGVTGIATFTDDIIIGNGKTIGSASDVDAMTIASNGQITLTQTLIGTALDISGDADIDGTLETDALSLNGTAVTSTAAELNILDGVTSTAAELNILDGVTSTAAELNILDGVTATATEINYTDGVTSAIQTQLDTKATTGKAIAMALVFG
jgi:hypothetical protein